MESIDQYLKLEPLFTNGMSTFQMNHFVIDDHITPYRKLKQAMVEAQARLENITSIGFDLEELRIKHKEAHEEYLKAESGSKSLLLDVQIRRFEFEINRKENLILQSKRESDFFLGVVSSIVETEFGSTEAAVAQLSSQDYQQDQEREFWTQKLIRSVFSDLINYGTISKGLMDSILCLPVEQQKSIVETATRKHVEYQKLLSIGGYQALAKVD